MQRLFLTLLAASLLACGAAGVAVQVSPDRVLDGDTVTVSVAGLPNGTVFSLQLEGAVAPAPDGTFSFATADLVMPFALEQGQVRAALENTATNELTVARGETRARMSGASQNGRYETERTIGIPAGRYDGLGLSGTAAPGAATVRTSLSLTGIKRGPENGTISFRVVNVTSGRMTVAVYANAEKVYGKEIALGPVASATPTTRAGMEAPLAVLAGLSLAAGLARRR